MMGQEHFKALEEHAQKLKDEKSIFGKLQVLQCTEKKSSEMWLEKWKHGDMEEFMKYESNTNKTY